MASLPECLCWIGTQRGNQLALLSTVMRHLQIARFYTRLGSQDEDERWDAVKTLIDIGPGALPCLHYAIRSSRSPRMQFAAAVALHGLNDPLGLELLVDALRWKLPSDPSLALDLEAAFVGIGADAVTALISVFPHITHSPGLMRSVCRIWAALRDPRILDVLFSQPVTLPLWPQLFEQTVPAFGESAINPLKLMANDPDPNRRALAIRTLGQIATPRSFSVLRPKLEDSDPNVRRLAPAALTAISKPFAVAVITDAVRNGYSSVEAIQTLSESESIPYTVLLEMVARWKQIPPHGDTQDAVVKAISVLETASLSNEALIGPICAVLTKKPAPEIVASIARLLGLRSTPIKSESIVVRQALMPWLISANRQVRAETAQALDRWGDPIGRELCFWLEECWPKGSLLTRLENMIRGADTSQLATQTMLQVSQWFTRMSRDTLERLTEGSFFNGITPIVEYDTRLPGLLRDILREALNDLHATPVTEEMLSLSVAAIRALSRLGVPDALCAHEELLRALNTVKYTPIYDGLNVSSQYRTERREVGSVVRTAAASILMECYGSRSFPLFLTALYSPQPEVHGTAILALSRLGDTRALTHLNAITSDPNHTFCLEAQEAIDCIRRTHPEVMTLLRASGPAIRPETLLRPASATGADHASDKLLRPTSETDCEPQS